MKQHMKTTDDIEFKKSDSKSIKIWMIALSAAGIGAYVVYRDTLLTVIPLYFITNIFFYVNKYRITNDRIEFHLRKHTQINTR